MRAFAWIVAGLIWSAVLGMIGYSILHTDQPARAETPHSAPPVQTVAPQAHGTARAAIHTTTWPSTAAQVVYAEPSQCQRDALAAARQYLPRDTGYRWVWADLDTDYAAGLTFMADRVVALSVHQSCQYIASTAFHEWMHTAGSVSTAPAPNGQELGEVLADCGGHYFAERAHVAWYWSYVDGCSPALERQALNIIFLNGTTEN